MNIFVLNSDPRIAAQEHLDKHIVKMPIEYAQLLSTAHRLLDGRLEERLTPEGRKKKFWLLGDERLVLKDFDVMLSNDDEIKGQLVKVRKLVIENPMCYGMSHQNHPCAIWARESNTNYLWLFRLLQETCIEYTHRYGRIHKTWTDVKDFLSHPPRNIAAGDLTPFPQAMGEEFKVPNDPISAYKNYYLGAKVDFARWTNRPTPGWFRERTKNYDSTIFERTSEANRRANQSA